MSAAARLAVAAGALSLVAAPVRADGVQGRIDTPQDLTSLSLEELALVEITSVSRRPESLAHAAAAVFVITRDDIRRSGAPSLPEVLRLAPNLDVQRVNAADYAISARGFNGYETSNKLLVLVDGRSVYSTLHSGVFWDAQDMVLEDIERIEVISGPGGALYGANAVNGVINIITRPAADTLGTAMSVGAGTEDNTVSLRHGGALGEAGAWRAYVRGFSRDDSLRPDGSDATDAAHGLRAGARFDWAAGDNQMTVQGDAFDNRVAINEDYSGEEATVRGGNILGRWTRPLAGGELAVQAYYDRFDRLESGGEEFNDTYDLHVQHAVALGARHQLVWGGGYRSIRSEFAAAPGGAFLDPATRTLTLGNLFVQDQIAVRDDLTLTLGAKFEDNSFSDQEFLPNARLAWTLPGGELLWGAVSRASRTPNRIERDLTLPGFLVGGSFESEDLTAYEAGFRAAPSSRSSLSVSAFYNAYDNLRTATFDPVTVFPIRLTNNGAGNTYGVEAWGSYDVTPRWRLSAGATTLHKDFEAAPGSDITALASAGDDPDYRLQLRSQADLTDSVQLDVRLRAVDELAATDGYVEADVRLGWRVNERLELSIAGQNLLDDQHFETGDPVRRRAFGRSVYASLRAGF